METITEARIWECTQSHSGEDFQVKLYTADRRLGIAVVRSDKDMSGIDATEWHQVRIVDNRLVEIV
jgi:hypothetical protein